MGAEDRTLEASALPRLVVVSSEGKEVDHYIGLPEMTIGRDPANRICIPDNFISKFHAKILASGGAFRLVDLGSANKTRVNGREVSEAILKYGDEVQFAGVKCRFLGPAGKVSAAASRGVAAASPARPPAAGAPPLQPTVPLPAAPLPVGRSAAPPRPGRSPMFKLYLLGGILIAFSILMALALRVLLAPEEPAAGDGSQSAATTSVGSPGPSPTTPSPVTPDSPTPSPDPAPTETSVAPAPPEGDAQKSESLLFDEALSLIGAGRLREARAKFLAILAQNPQNSRARGRLTLLEEQMEKEIELHFNSGRQAFTYLRYDEAIAEFEQVLLLAEPSDSRYLEAQKGIQDARAKKR
jgi:hypothetical protein